MCAVSYLNTVPLVWGLEHGAQRGLFDVSFRLPSECADLLAGGQADIGIVPSFELTRQKLEIVRGAGIACRGAVRSILLVSKLPAPEIGTLAADSSSRSSVALARIVLARSFGVRPRLISRPPDLERMLQEADAALIIGDPALRVDPSALPWHVYDLGLEWERLTGLPMVFAVWAGRKGFVDAAVERAFLDSCRAGLANIDAIVAREAPARGFAPELVRRYLTEHIVFELGPREYAGMETFLEYASAVQSAA